MALIGVTSLMSRRHCILKTSAGLMYVTMRCLLLIEASLSWNNGCKYRKCKAKKGNPNCFQTAVASNRSRLWHADEGIAGAAKLFV